MSTELAPAAWLPQSLSGSSRSYRRDANSTVRVAVVLSGGGLRGAGHIGVLQQLVAHDIPIDIIVGSKDPAKLAALKLPSHKRDLVITLRRGVTDDVELWARRKKSVEGTSE